MGGDAHFEVKGTNEEGESVTVLGIDSPKGIVIVEKPGELNSERKDENKPDLHAAAEESQQQQQSETLPSQQVDDTASGSK